MTKEELRVKLNDLNDFIKTLTVWDEYAEMWQSRYDILLKEYNEKADPKRM